MAQPTAVRSASMSVRVSSEPPPSGENRKTPPAAIATQSKSITRREATIATASGPVNAVAETIPSGARSIASKKARFRTTTTTPNAITYRQARRE